VAIEGDRVGMVWRDQVGETVLVQLADVMRVAGAVRRFRADPVPLQLVYRLLDDARFAPSGGNRQPWRVIVVSDAALRAGLGELFRSSWYTHHAPLFAVDGQIQPDEYADHVHEVPVHLLILVKLAGITTTISALDSSRVVGGASVYPFVQNILLGARSLGMGSALTTVLVPVEAQVRQLLRIPEGYTIAAHLALGWPAVPLPTRLKRAPVSQFATLDTFTGLPLTDTG
jgi:nitroreductase